MVKFLVKLIKDDRGNPASHTVMTIATSTFLAIVILIMLAIVYFTTNEQTVIQCVNAIIQISYVLAALAGGNYAVGKMMTTNLMKAELPHKEEP